MVVPVETSVEVDTLNTGMSTIASPSANSTQQIEGDWHVHMQTLNVAFVVQNVYDSAVSGPIAGGPNVSHHQWEARYSVQTTDRILSGMTFSGTHQQAQSLKIISDGSAGGLGVSGHILTTSAGSTRLVLNKNELGVPSDPVGVCNATGNLIIGVTPGPYKNGAVFDTSNTVAAKLYEILNDVPDVCPTFNPILVKL